MSELKQYDLDNELWREYDFCSRVYRIENPKCVFIRKNGTTHRVIDENDIAHCVPAPGIYGCVLRFKSNNIVDF